MSKKVLVGVAAVMVVGAVASYASPYWTIYQMRSAIEKRDAEKFSTYVDYPALRESLKAQLLISLQGDVASSPELKDNPFAGLGQIIGLAMVNTLVETMGPPAGVMALMAGEKPGPKPSALQAPAPAPAPEPDTPRKDAAKDTLRYDVSYRSWDLVQATATKENGEPITADLRRDGLWSWKWVGIKIPDLSKP
nr:DUF2939 domain-containing protein [uncultured Cupriavidus sp.]